MARKRETVIRPRFTRQLPGDGHLDGPVSGSLLRGLEILAAFRSGGGRLGNTELAVATGLPRATVSRLTRGLLEAGYLDYDPASKRYQLRPRVLTLGFSLLSNLPILPIAHEHMLRLAKASGCTISLAAPDGSEMIYLDRCSGESLPYFFSTGSAIETARTASGRAYLAALSTDLRNDALSQLRPHYPDDWDEISQGIEGAITDVSVRGFCLVDNTWRRGIRALAAPLVSRDLQTIFAVSCVTATHSIDMENFVGQWGPALVHLADELRRHF